MSGATAGHDPPLLSSLCFEDLAVGERWGPFTVHLEADASDRLRGAIGSRSSGDQAPPGVLPVLSLRALRLALMGIPPGGVLIRQRFSSHFPLAAEGDVTADLTLVAQHRRPSGLYSTFSFAFAQDGRLCAVAEWTILAPPLEEVHA